MLEAHAMVIRAETDYAWVEPERDGGCQACAVRSGCGTRALGQVLGRRQSALRVRDPLSSAPGDRVVVAIADEVLLWSSLLMYGLPLVAMISGAALAQAWVGNELAAVLGGGVGLTAGLWLAARWGGRASRMSDRHQPVILRRAALADLSCQDDGVAAPLQ